MRIIGRESRFGVPTRPTLMSENPTTNLKVAGVLIVGGYIILQDTIALLPGLCTTPLGAVVGVMMLLVGIGAIAGGMTMAAVATRDIIRNPRRRKRKHRGLSTKGSRAGNGVQGHLTGVCAA